MYTYHASIWSRSQNPSNDRRAHMWTYKRRCARTHCMTRRSTSVFRHAPRPTPHKLLLNRNRARANRAWLLLLAHLANASSKEVGSTHRPPLLLLAAAGRAGRQRLILVVEEEPRAPAPLPQHLERARDHLSWQSCALTGTPAAFAFFQARDRQGEGGAEAYLVEHIWSELYRNLELRLGGQRGRDRSGAPHAGHTLRKARNARAHTAP